MHLDKIITDRIPIILSRENEVVACVKRLLDTHGNDEKAVKMLDVLFYKIFGLDEQEIKMVEEAFPQLGE